MLNSRRALPAVTKIRIVMPPNTFLTFLIGLLVATHITANDLQFVPEDERGDFWTLQVSDIPPRLGIYLRPGYFASFEIDYTINSDGTVADAFVSKATDSKLPPELLMEMISTHRYLPSASNKERKPIRTRMLFTLGAPQSHSENKTCPHAAAEKTSQCPG